MRRFILAFFVLTLAVSCCGIPEESIDLTLDEKLGLTHAQSRFSSAGVPRLGIPDLWWSDGPNGIRAEALWDSWAQAGWTSDSCTAYPALTCLAATWSEPLATEMGICLGEEALYRGKDVLLGPGINIMRLPTAGRNFEYMGEDPFLSGKMASAYIRGVQSQGVAACVKHFALNNQEKARTRVDVHLSDRALQEIYLPAFRMAVQEGGVWSVMAAYNRIWDMHCSDNSRLLTDILRRDWGFDGVVVSDWGAVHSTDAAAAGLDVEMGTNTDGLRDNPDATDYNAFHFAEPYKQKLLSGEIPMEVLDTQVSRILRLHERTTMRAERGVGRFVCPEHSAVARRVGEEGIVLLENNGILPLDTLKALTVLVAGENAIKKMAVGGGSSSLKAKYEITPLEGIQKAFPLANVRFERAYVGDVGEVYWGVSAGQDLSDSRSPEQLISDAVAAAQGADVILFVGGLNKSRNQDREGRDRLSYGLPYGQDDVLEALLDTGIPLVYVNISGNPVALPWHDRAAAIVQAWYLGSEAGPALGAVLSGKVNPSGKLPYSWPSSLEDTPFYRNELTYPGILREDGHMMDVYYDEGIFVGYRWYDRACAAPLYPFGHGLSYTTFEYSGMKASFRGGKLRVSLVVKNIGPREGQETVQLYVGAPAAGEGEAYERPEKELKAFQKVSLCPGESRKISFEVPLSGLGYYDETLSRFVTVSGRYSVNAGASSGDIRLEEEIMLTER